MLRIARKVLGTRVGYLPAARKVSGEAAAQVPVGGKVLGRAVEHFPVGGNVLGGAARNLSIARKVLGAVAESFRTDQARARRTRPGGANRIGAAGTAGSAITSAGNLQIVSTARCPEKRQCHDG
jgi:hypothetical protein